jgi:DNA polymerase III sliding clamp (beta) subunit (PCNA family)
MKISVYLEEVYPVVCFDEEYAQYEIEVDEKLLKRAKKALELFDETQGELRKIINQIREEQIRLYRIVNK